ncbi:glycosyltransferase [Chitinibacter bivalviorum]|uniref:Glycosyltransferase n=1 Tax=Chitinibacter bivalviorum TaxID=2739434 RepID=A0A7H9BKK8_9NEIS|nr:glycosyltransferase family 2 protein [Chitinibacter bivalviorum]QLG88798.1 glycosyltransferase [Chitinibacter bivalviorum]
MSLVSFILPCFNSAEYLQQTIDSIFAQQYTHWECIAIDDGSMDLTLSILQQAAAQDARFKIISRGNRGLIASLNEGIAAAQGEWIARIDADDICLPQRLTRQLAYMAETGADVCGSWIEFIGERSGQWQTPQTDAGIRIALLFNTPLAHPSILARADILKANPYPLDAPHAEDYSLWCILAAKGVRFANVPEVLLQYRCHAGQVTQAKRAALRITAQRVREQYAQTALPVPLQPLAARFAELAEPGRIINRDEWHWMRDFFEHLLQLCPESRAVLGEIWLDTLQRTRGVSVRDFAGAARLYLRLPPPAAEHKKLRKQMVRLLVSDRVWRSIKR